MFNHPGSQTKRSFNREICPKGLAGMANSADQDQIASEGAV